MEILAIEKFGLAALDPFSARQRLTLGTVAISAGNGEISITCLMGSIF
jgi:hypothetical protein